MTMECRNYQLELFKEIQKKDAILFLPTGSGKTFIALCLMKHMAADLKKPIEQGGKRMFFIGNTVDLVCQQMKVIEKQTNFTVIALFGDVGVDNMKQNEWSELEEKFDVFVLTSQVYLNALTHGYLLSKNANLLIFDECHHAVNNHPMAQIMAHIRKGKPEDAPKILGLTATLLNANINEGELRRTLDKLEETFNSEILTTQYSKDVIMKFSAKPKEILERLDRFIVPSPILTKLELIKTEAEAILEHVKFTDDVNIFETEDFLLRVPGANRCKLLKNVFKDIVVHVTSFGLYIGYECCQAYIVQLYRFMYTSMDEPYRSMIKYTLNIAQIFRKLLYQEIVKNESIDSVTAIKNTSTQKVAFLLDRLTRMKESDRCIVFVERKMTAKCLFNILKEEIADQMSIDYRNSIGHSILTIKKESTRVLNDERPYYVELFRHLVSFIHVITVGEVEQGEKVILFHCSDEKSVWIIRKFGIFKYSKWNHDTVSIKSDFMIGSDSNPLRNTREGLYEKKERKKILKNFKKGLTNVLVATNLLEEGIDIQSCNLVIMFDELKTFRSYVQSKGRARMAGGEYIILFHDAGMHPRIQKYRQLENELEDIIDLKAVDSNMDDGGDTTDVGETYFTPANAFVDYVSSVPLVYKYCGSLPRDIFTQLTPYWFITKDSHERGLRQCRLQLPVNAAIRFPIMGIECSTAKTARKSAAFEAVKQLHQIGALDDYLEPIRTPKEIEDKDYWFPNWDYTDTSGKSDGTRSQTIVSDMRIPIFLQNSRPLPDTECYLHVIRTATEYPEPNIPRKLYCHELMKTSYCYGILTRHRLPSVCEFPVFTDLGRVRIHIECNANCFKLDCEQISDVAQFHKFLFLDILRVVRKSCVYDKHDSHGYYVVPLKPKANKNGKPELHWKVMKMKINSTIARPTVIEVKKQDYSEKEWLGKIVIPWYIVKEPKQYYLVVDASTNLSLCSNFSDSKFKTYAEYFEVKYKLESKRPAQPMLEVRALTNLLDGIRPRPVTANAKNTKRTKHDLPTYLAPEFCIKQDFPSVFWYKSIIIPSVLHRLYYLLMAEDLRQKIVEEAKVGSLILPPDSSDTVEHFLPINNTTMPREKSKPQSKKALTIKSKAHVSTNEVQEEPPINIYHEVELNLQEIKKYAEYVETPLFRTSTKKKCLSNETNGTSFLGVTGRKTGHFKINVIEPPSLLTLKNYANAHGPKADEILQAITLKAASDIIDMERLETLGDSFLKFMVSISLFVKCAHMNEGQLSALKGLLIGNKYLFYCGRKLEIASYMKATKFAAKDTWHPPGFSVPEILKDSANKLDMPSSIFSVKIPYHEQFSGEISLLTIDNIGESLRNFMSKVEERKVTDDILAEFQCGKQHFHHKSISDVMEALIGVYLKTTGIRGAFSVLKYFGILAREDLDSLIRKDIPSPVIPNAIGYVDQIFPDGEVVEKLIGYRFRDKAFLLQAFTHPSFMSNSVTDCYQRLEFVGDAVLDFLITSYIYEHCGALTPGQLTDLRSSLVNNNTFGALAVRLGLHKFLLSHSKALQDAIEPFLAYQESKNHEIYGNQLMILINEGDSKIAEEVDVPKALGDVFESLAGAIYLDSGCSLQIVWEIYYSIMKTEIEKFSKNIPINPVRALYEKANFKFFVPAADDDERGAKNQIKKGNRKYEGKVYATVKLGHSCFTVCGKGPNLSSAKRAAAKLALKEMNENDFVI